jgi:TRAP-type mannitol/chloroaromatic compound transport system permease small subunit
MPGWATAGRRRIDIFGHVLLLIPSMLALLYWSWPSVRNSWKILEGPISVGGIEAVFLLKSLIPAFCVLILLQSLSVAGAPVFHPPEASGARP